MIINLIKKGINIQFFSWLIFISLFSVVYHETIIWMYQRYMSPDSYYSHGFIVPFIVGYLVWCKRNSLEIIEGKNNIIGLAVIVTALMIHIIATSLYIFSISGFSIIILLVGVCVYIYGVRFTRVIWFSLAYIIFMIPMPLAFISMISFPLRIFVTEYGVKLVRLSGIPVLREGFIISIPQGVLLVGNPCSGMRSLIAFLAIGAIFAYLSNLNNARKMILVLLTIPIALITNLIRVFFLVIWSYKFGLASAAPETIIHTLSGIMVFGIGMILLFVAMILLRKFNEA